MKRETFFRALSETDDKYVKSAMDRFTDAPGKEIAHKIGKAIYYVAGVAAIIAIVLAIWIPSVIFRDKPIEPAVSDTAAINDTDPDASAETDPDPETDPVTEPVTDPVTDTETDAPGPKTDEEIIAALVDDLAANGYSAEKWDALKAYGDVAFELLIKLYYRGTLDQPGRIVISCFTTDYMREEIEGADSEDVNAAFEGAVFVDPSEGISDVSNLYLLSNLFAKAKIFATKTEKAEFKQLLPRTYILLSTRGFNDYAAFAPEKHTVAECVDRYIEAKTATQHSSAAPGIMTYLCNNGNYEIRREAAAYCAVRYQTETDATVRALLGWMFYKTAYSDISAISGLDYTRVRNNDNGTRINESNVLNYKELFEPVISDFITLAKDLLRSYPKIQAETDYPYACAVLDALGFDGYKPGEPDIAFRARDTVKGALELANALTYGVGRHDATSVCYGDPDDPNSPELPAALAEAIKDNGVDYYEGFSTQAEGFKTADEWKRYYKKILSDSIVESAVRSTNYFVIVGTTVYTSDEMWVGTYEIDITGLKVTGEKNGVSTLSTNVMIPWGMGHYDREVTFEVTEDKNGIKIVGGTFAEIFLETGTTKGKAALTVFELLQIKAMLIDGEGGFEAFRGYQEPKTLNTQEELIKFYKDDYYAGDPPVLSDDAFPIYAHNGWDDDDSWEWMIKSVLPEEYYDILITFNGRVINAGSYILIKAGDGTGAAPVIGPAGGLTLTDVYNAIKVKSNKNGKMTVSLDFNVKENGVAKTVTYTFEIDGSRLTGGTFKDRFFDFQKAVDPAKLTVSVLGSFHEHYVVDPADVFDMSDPAGCNAPQVLIDAVNKNFGGSGKDQIYYRYNGLFELSYLRNTAARFFTDDVLTRLFDDNRKMFVEGDRVLYINADILNFKNIGVSKATLKKTGENKYEIDVSLIDNGEQTPSAHTYTAKIQITSGKVVVTGGTFLDFIFEKMLVTK